MPAVFDAPSVSAFLAVPLDYALARLDEADWVETAGGALEYRDLLLGKASKGQMGSRNIRAVRAGSYAGWPNASDAFFRFLYLVNGEVTFEAPGRDTIVLAKGDTIARADLGADCAVSWSANFDAVEIVACDWSVAGSPPDPVALLQGLQDWQVGVTPVLTREGPEHYRSDGLRKFLSYRDFGLIETTERRIHIHDIEAIGTPPGGTGWHVHSMTQLFYVTRGWVDIGVDGQGVIRMKAGDAMCVSNGLRHNVSAFAPDYKLIEMCLPADYSTVPTPAPEKELAPA